jgi:DNA-binding GntR family transcriptional regulator
LTRKPASPGLDEDVPSRPAASNEVEHELHPGVDAANLSLVQDVYQQILARIVRGELPGGSELKSTRLSQELGVSRTPVVQALSRLIADGIVTQRMNMRAVVTPGAENWLIDIHELRLLLEPPAAAQAARHMTQEALDRLQQAAESISPNSDDRWPARAREFDFVLHLKIADHCGNQPLRSAIYKCWDYKRLSYELAADRIESILRGYGEHQSILAALLEHDSATAAAAMELHLRHASSYRPERRIV